MFKLLRMLASAAIGLPLSLVANSMAGIAWSAVKVASIAHTHTIKIFTGATQTTQNPIIEDLKKDIEGFMGSTWSKFGFYWFIEGTKTGYDWLKSSMSELGFGDSRDQSADSGDIALALEGRVKDMLRKRLKPLDEKITEINEERLIESFNVLHRATKAMFDDKIGLPDNIIKIDEASYIIDIAEKNLTKGVGVGEILHDRLHDIFATARKAGREVELNYEAQINLSEIKNAFLTLVMAERNEEAPLTSKELGRAVYTIQALEESIAAGENIGTVRGEDGRNIFTKLQEFEGILKDVKDVDFKKLDMTKLLAGFAMFERGDSPDSIIKPISAEITHESQTALTH